MVVMAQIGVKLKIVNNFSSFLTFRFCWKTFETYNGRGSIRARAKLRKNLISSSKRLSFVMILSLCCFFFFQSGPLSSPQKLSRSGLSSQSTFTWDRGSPDRPSSSPSPTDTRKFSAQQVAPRSFSRSNTRFSRHMARSAPDIQILSLDDPS